MLIGVLCVAQCIIAGGAADPIRPFFGSIRSTHVEQITIHDLDKQFGVGKVSVGGHPNSGRVWRRGNIVAHANGWVPYKGSYLVETLLIELSGDKKSDGVPSLSSWASSQLGWPSWLHKPPEEVILDLYKSGSIANLISTNKRTRIECDFQGLTAKAPHLGLVLKYQGHKLYEVELRVYRG
jgi:hypothetical protein